MKSTLTFALLLFSSPFFIGCSSSTLQAEHERLQAELLISSLGIARLEQDLAEQSQQVAQLQEELSRVNDALKVATQAAIPVERQVMQADIATIQAQLAELKEAFKKEVQFSARVKNELINTEVTLASCKASVAAAKRILDTLLADEGGIFGGNNAEVISLQTTDTHEKGPMTTLVADAKFKILQVVKLLGG